MRRIDIRTPGAWRSFDFWSGIIALSIPLALAGLWIAGVTPPMSSCCGVGGNAAQAPLKAAAGSAAAKIDCATITNGAQIAFATGSAELTGEGKAELDAIAPCLTAGKWEIGGHTDNAGSNEVNQPLSWRRAAAAVEYLRQSKGEATPLKAVGYGAIDPIAANDTDDGRAKNRRLTFKQIRY